MFLDTISFSYWQRFKAGVTTGPCFWNYIFGRWIMCEDNVAAVTFIFGLVIGAPIGNYFTYGLKRKR